MVNMQNNFKKCSSKSLKELIKMGGSNNSIELARIMQIDMENQKVLLIYFIFIIT